VLWSLSCLLGWAVPSHETIRSWVLRLGLFLLRRPLERASDWVFIFDHTTSLGKLDCLLILGVRLGSLSPDAFAPGHRDVVVLDLDVSDKADAGHVRERLEAACQRAGLPEQVVSDHASNLVKAIALLQADHPGVVDTYDVTHQLALLVERQLKADGDWDAFQKGCSQSLWQLQKSAGAFLVPPRQRTKARYMSVQGHVSWASDVLALLGGANRAELARQLGMAEGEAGPWLEGKLGWLRGYSAAVGRYAGMMALVRAVEQEVKTRGLGRQTAGRIRAWLAGACLPPEGLADFTAGVLGYLEREGGKVPQGRQWLGSSDVIESLFGKYKVLSGRAPFSEVGASVLGLAALTVEWTPELISQALGQVSNADVQAWLEEHVGLSTLAKSHKVFAPLHSRDLPARPTQPTGEVPRAGPTSEQGCPQRGPPSGDANLT
jgi:hypothetical protein